ncbi:unnamed protein product [Lampetra fluviatilis]
MGQWTYDLCGCFENCSLCLLTWLAPCVTAGHNAEDTGQGSFVACCLVFPFAGWWFTAQSRKKTREMRGIDGSFGQDLLLACFLPWCTMVQIARVSQTPSSASAASPATHRAARADGAPGRGRPRESTRHRGARPRELLGEKIRK